MVFGTFLLEKRKKKHKNFKWMKGIKGIFNKILCYFGMTHDWIVFYEGIIPFHICYTTIFPHSLCLQLKTWLLLFLIISMPWFNDYHSFLLSFAPFLTRSDPFTPSPYPIHCYFVKETNFSLNPKCYAKSK